MEDREPYITGGKMREIKFRGWDNENKKWRYGWLTKLVEGIRQFWAIVLLEDGELTRYYIHSEGSIGQFTGLLDKNGKEIYDGDIVENILTKREFIHPKGKQKSYYRNMKRKTKCAIRWDDHWACWEFTEKIERGVLEIIGNTYENPELLK